MTLNEINNIAVKYGWQLVAGDDGFYCIQTASGLFADNWQAYLHVRHSSKDQLAVSHQDAFVLALELHATRVPKPMTADRALFRATQLIAGFAGSFVHGSEAHIEAEQVIEVLERMRRDENERQTAYVRDKPMVPRSALQAEIDAKASKPMWPGDPLR